MGNDRVPVNYAFKADRTKSRDSADSAAITLTGSYAYTSVINASDYNTVGVDVIYTAAVGETSNTADFVIVANTDGNGTRHSNYCGYMTAGGGTISPTQVIWSLAQATAGGDSITYYGTIPNFSCKEFRIGFKETGMSANYGTITLAVRLSCE
jgi:hypothetical protein